MLCKINRNIDQGGADPRFSVEALVQLTFRNMVSALDTSKHRAGMEHMCFQFEVNIGWGLCLTFEPFLKIVVIVMRSEEVTDAFLELKQGQTKMEMELRQEDVLRTHL